MTKNHKTIIYGKDPVRGSFDLYLTKLTLPNMSIKNTLVPKVLITFSCSMGLPLWGLSLIGCFIKSSVQPFQPLILIYRRDNIVYYHWGCTSIYRPLSYPFRSLGKP